MKFLLTLLQLTIASPLMNNWGSAIEQAMDQSMMNMDVFMAILGRYEEEQLSLNQIEPELTIHSNSFRTYNFDDLHF